MIGGFPWRCFDTCTTPSECLFHGCVNGFEDKMARSKATLPPSPFMEIGKKRLGRPPGKKGKKVSYSSKSAVPKSRVFKGTPRGR